MAKDPSPKLASGDTAYLYRAAIGPRAQDYYLRHFARFDSEGKTGSSWNWAAYWTTFNWLVYRKMWGWALAYVAALMGLALLVFGVGKLVFNYSDTSAVLLSLFLLAAAFVLPGLYANAWFYTHCNEKISNVLRTSPEVKDAATVLANQAPDSRRLLLLGVGNALLLTLVAVLVHGFQTSESALPQLASREEHPSAGGQSGQVREVTAEPVTPAVTAATPAAPTVDSTPSATPVAPAPAPAVAAAPETPQLAQAASVSPAPAQAPAPATARPAVSAKKPAMVNASDRSTAPAKPEAAVTAPVRPAAVTAVAAADPSAPAAAPRATTVAAPAPRLRYVWVIQVGAYAQEANAQKALADVQALGLEAGAESFESPKGKLMRVRVGPFTQQAEADQAALRIKSLNLPTLVIRQRP